jgi:hypothetical protein
LVLSVLTLPAASNVSSAMMAGQLIAIQSAQGRAPGGSGGQIGAGGLS